jgi:hypothetical protein
MASRAQAVVIAYEGFDYEPAPIGAQNGGTGWTGDWVNDTGGTGEIRAGGMTYTDSMGNALVVSGNRAFVSGESSAAGQVGRALPQIGDDPEGDGGVTTWWSFLGQRLAPHEMAEENVKRASSLQIHNTLAAPAERLAAGKGTTGPGGPLPDVRTEWSMLHSANAGNSVFTTKPILEKAFLVVRIDHFGAFADFATPDSAYLWVNPRLDAEPAIASADVQYLRDDPLVLQDFTFDRIRTFTGATNAVGLWAEFDFDEIRLGTTYADVAPFTATPTPNANFDGDSDVDGGDLLIWQKGLGLTGQTTNANGDADRNGTVAGPDLGVWRSQFGPASVSAIPEPSTIGLAAMAIAALRMKRRPA